MAKIILILGILAMGGATFFGIKNRAQLIDLKRQTIEINDRIDAGMGRSGQASR